MVKSEIEKSAIRVIIETTKIEMTVGIAARNATIAIIAIRIIVVKNKIVQILQIRIALKQIKDHALISRRVQRL